jgi:lysophospholipase L1-like esterase
VALLLLVTTSGIRRRSRENPAVIPSPQIAAWWMARHEDRVLRAKEGGVDLLFVGDSITQNYERTGPPPDQVFLPTWEDLFSRYKPLNLGFAGDQTQNVLWRLQHGEVDGLSPANIILLIGTNNTMPNPDVAGPQTAEEVVAGIQAVVDELHRRMPAAKILLIKILPSGESVQKTTKDAQVNAAVCEGYAHSDYLHCMDLAYLFVKDGVVDPTLFYDPAFTNQWHKVSNPALHPNTRGQRMMAEAVSQALFGPSGRN